SSDPDGTVAGGELSVDGSPKASIIADGVYNFFLPIGKHSVSVVVIDNLGANSLPATATVHVAVLPTVNQPPSAGFVITSAGHSVMSAPLGQTTQTLDLEVVPWSSIGVSFDGSVPHSLDPDGSIVAWQWRINGTIAESSSTFNRSLT